MNHKFKVMVWAEEGSEIMCRMKKTVLRAVHWMHETQLLYGHKHSECIEAVAENVPFLSQY